MTLTEQQKHYTALILFIGFMLIVTPFAIAWALGATVVEIIKPAKKPKQMSYDEVIKAIEALDGVAARNRDGI